MTLACCLLGTSLLVTPQSAPPLIIPRPKEARWDNSSKRLNGWRARGLAFIGVVLIRLYRSGVMLALAFGASAPRLSERWNRA